MAVSLVKDGFRLAQDFYWYNPARLPSPAEWVTVRQVRVKDAVNMVWWFSKADNPKADNRKALRPYSPSMLNLLTPRFGPDPNALGRSGDFARRRGVRNTIVLFNSQAQPRKTIRRCFEHNQAVITWMEWYTRRTGSTCREPSVDLLALHWKGRSGPDC
jgi:hypothetical protein